MKKGDIFNALSCKIFIKSNVNVKEDTCSELLLWPDFIDKRLCLLNQSFLKFPQHNQWSIKGLSVK